MTRIIDYCTSFTIVSVEHVAQPIKSEIHFTQGSIWCKTNVIFWDTQRLLTVNLKYFTIVLGKWNALLVLVVLVGDNYNKSFIVFCIIDVDLSIYNLSLSYTKAQN